MNLASMSKHSIEPEQVSRDNSDLWRYSTVLFSELRKEKYSKADPAAYLKYCEAVGLESYSEPFKDIDLKLDIEKFKTKLKGVDLEVFTLMLLGMKHREIKDIVGISQASVSLRLKRIRSLFKDFYFD